MQTRRDYQKKSFKNPFFSSQKSGSARRLRFLFLFFLIFAILAFFFLSPKNLFEIQEIKVVGNQTINADDITAVVKSQSAEKRFFFLPQTNLLFFNSSELRKKLEQDYIFSGLTIDKQLFHSLTIEIQEDIAPFFWFSNAKSYYLTAAGKAVKAVGLEDLSIQASATGTEVIRFAPRGKNYPTVFDQSNTEVILGEPIVDTTITEFITQLTASINSYADFEIASYSISSPYSFDLTLVTTEGWQIYFRMSEPLDQQFNKLIALLREKLKTRANLEYIDLRFSEKVFYK